MMISGLLFLVLMATKGLSAFMPHPIVFCSLHQQQHQQQQKRYPSRNEDGSASSTATKSTRTTVVSSDLLVCPCPTMGSFLSSSTTRLNAMSTFSTEDTKSYASSASDDEEDEEHDADDEDTFTIGTDHAESSDNDGDSNKSALSLEFRAKINSFLELQDSLVIYDNPRLQALFDGVVASAYEPAVYRSFEILFEDLLPLRLAGRMIFGRLYTNLQEQYAQPQQVENQYIQEQLSSPSTSPAVSVLPKDIHKSRQLFLSVVNYCRRHSQYEESSKHSSDDAAGAGVLQVSKQHLIDLGISKDIAVAMLQMDEDMWLQQFDNKKETIDFASFFITVSRNVQEQQQQDRNITPLSILQDISKSLPPAETTIQFDKKNQKHVERYEFMVQSFKEWQEYVLPSSMSGGEEKESRRLDVLRGCFVGARNAKVVQALQIVYTDYAALRVAGNLIFKLMSALVPHKQK